MENQVELNIQLVDSVSETAGRITGFLNELNAVVSTIPFSMGIAQPALDSFSEGISQTTEKIGEFITFIDKCQLYVERVISFYDLLTTGVNSLRKIIESTTVKQVAQNVALKFNEIYLRGCALAQAGLTFVTRLWNKATDKAVQNAMFRLPLALTQSTIGTAIYTAVVVPATFATYAFSYAIKAVSKAIYAIPIVGWIAAIVSVVIVLIDLIIQGFNWLWDNCVEFREIVFGIWEVISTVFSNIWQVISEVASSIWDVCVSVWDGICGFLTSVGEGIASFFVSIWQNVTGFLASFWEGVCGFFVGLWQGIISTFSSAWNAITGFFTGIWNGLVNTFAPIRNWITQNIIQPIKDAFSGLWGFITNTLNKVMNKLDGLFAPIRELWNKIFGGTSETWDKGKAKGRASFEKDAAERAKKEKEKSGELPEGTALSEAKDLPEMKDLAAAFPGADTGKGMFSVGNVGKSDFGGLNLNSGADFAGSGGAGEMMSGQIDATASAGAGRTVNNQITIGSLIESLTIQSGSVSEGVEEMKTMVTRALMEALNSQNVVASY